MRSGCGLGSNGCRRRGRGWRNCLTSCIADYFGRSWCFNHSCFQSWLRDCRRCLNRDRGLLFHGKFNWLNCWLDRRNGGCRRRDRRLRRNHYRRRWTCNRLRSDESWRRLWRFDWTDHSCARGDHWLSDAAGRTRRHGRRRSNSLPRRHGRSSGTWRCDGLSGLLRNRLQDVSWLGDVRQVDLGLELFRLRARTATRTAARLAVLRIILLHALRLVHFNGAGVRLLFRDSDLDQ
jgi:hypothetical protein